MNCVIFGGADIFNYDAVRRNMPEAPRFVIAADRGLLHCRALGITPDIIMGDFDSLGEEPPQGTNIIRAPKEKDDTDTMLAVKYIKKNGIGRDVVIFGCIGGRMGHTIANIQTLSYISGIGMRGKLVGDDCIMQNIVPADGKCYFRSSDDTGYYSIFSLSERSEVIIEGLKYSGRITLERTFPLGVSNEPLSGGKQWSAEVISGEILLIEEKK